MIMHSAMTAKAGPTKTAMTFTYAARAPNPFVRTVSKYVGYCSRLINAKNSSATAVSTSDIAANAKNPSVTAV